MQTLVSSIFSCRIVYQVFMSISIIGPMLIRLNSIAHGNSKIMHIFAENVVFNA